MRFAPALLVFCSFAVSINPAIYGYAAVFLTILLMRELFAVKALPVSDEGPVRASV
jgi:hypothetical protein